VAEARGQFGNPEERKCPPLEAITRGLAKRPADQEDSVHAIVNCTLQQIELV
jgi:hypothetical protein